MSSSHRGINNGDFLSPPNKIRTTLQGRRCGLEVGGHITSSRMITHIVRAQRKMLSKIKIQGPFYLTYLTLALVSTKRK